MPKIILLPVRGSTADQDVFAAALNIGRSFDAHLIGLHVRPDVRRDVASLAASDGGMSAGIDTMLGRMEEDADARETAAAQGWREFCERNDIPVADTPKETGMTAEWATEIGTEADWVAEYGRTVDLIVVGRGEAEWGPDLVLMEAALMNTGKPVVIAPRASAANTPLTGVVGIAWKDTREAAGAVRAAMPFLENAGQITIFVVLEDEEDGDRSHLRLSRMLKWRNKNVTIHALKAHARTPAEVMLEAVIQANCGLLVMGGYGHGRLREAVFGGFTRAVLEAAPLPVLLAH